MSSASRYTRISPPGRRSPSTCPYQRAKRAGSVSADHRSSISVWKRSSIRTTPLPFADRRMPRMRVPPWALLVIGAPSFESRAVHVSPEDPASYFDDEPADLVWTRNSPVARESATYATGATRLRTSGHADGGAPGRDLRSCRCAQGVELWSRLLSCRTRNSLGWLHSRSCFTPWHGGSP